MLKPSKIEEALGVRAEYFFGGYFSNVAYSSEIAALEELIGEPHCGTILQPGYLRGEEPPKRRSILERQIASPSRGRGEGARQDSETLTAGPPRGGGFDALSATQTTQTGQNGEYRRRDVESGAPAAASVPGCDSTARAPFRPISPQLTNRGVQKSFQPDTANFKPSTPNDCGDGFDDNRDDAETFEYYANVPFYGGYDGGCEVGYYGEWVEDPETGEGFDALRDALNDAKEAAQEKPENGIVELGGLTFLVRPKGGSGEVRYKFLLDGAGMTVSIHNNPKSGIQPVRVRFGFEALHNRNFFEVERIFEDWLARIGFKIEREVLSRIDLQVTLATSPKPLFNAIQSGCRIARGRAENWNGRVGTGAETYTLGKDTQICIYDKLRELLVKRDDAKLKNVLAMFDEFPGELTRVEFRLRRDSLKNFNVSTINDLKEREEGILDYLLQSWFRVTDRPCTKTGNTTRFRSGAFWLRVVEAFKKSFGENNDVDDNDRKPFQRRDRTVVRCEPVELMRQAVGVLASCAAQCLGVTQDAEKVYDFLFDFVKSNYRKICAKANERAFLREVKSGVCVEKSDSVSDDASIGGFVRNGVQNFFKAIYDGAEALRKRKNGERRRADAERVKEQPLLELTELQPNERLIPRTI